MTPDCSPAGIPLGWKLIFFVRTAFGLILQSTTTIKIIGHSLTKVNQL